MELFREKNKATIFTFPLVLSESNEYYTSAWANLTDSSISAFSWNDNDIPVYQTISQTPVQIGSTGIFYLSATATEMNPISGASDYLLISIKAEEIRTQSMLIILNDFSLQDLNSNYRTILGLNSSNTIDEITAVPVNPTISEALSLDYLQRRNKQITDASSNQIETYNDAGIKLFTATISDDGTIFTKNKLS
jgi:hypothetical protein